MRIGIMGAMREEVERFLEVMSQEGRQSFAGIIFVQGKLHGKDVVVCQTGVGKVNAAMCTQILIDRYEVDAMIFTGVAGAVAPHLEVGDIVISEDCMHHDMDATALGFARGMIPFSPQSVFVADEEMKRLALQAAREVGARGVVLGRVLSGDQFVADSEVVNQLYLEMNGSCVEMEGAAMAQVCALQEVPFVIIRSISDKADRSAQVSFNEFVAEVAERSLSIVERMVQRMPVRIRGTL